MKYLIIGIGGVGGSIGGFLAANGEDVTFIARGTHLQKMKEEGLKIESGIKGEFTICPINVCEQDEFKDKADVIFVCVKGYSLEDVIPLVRRSSHNNTIVIPLLNGIGTGDKIYNLFKEALILDGCIYITAYISSPGEVVQSDKIFRVVFGPRKNQDVLLERINEVKEALCSAGIKAIISTNIERDTFAKFSFISPYASCGAYHDITAKDMQHEGVYRKDFIKLTEEILSLAKAMGITFEQDILKRNLDILDALSPDNTASMQKDIKSGKNVEVDQLVFEVIRLSEKYSIDIPKYTAIGESFGYK